MNEYIDAWLSLEGGNAANTASALARLGRSTKLISKARFPMGSPWVSLENQFLGLVLIWWQTASAWIIRAQE